MDQKFNTTKDWEKSLTRELAEAEASFRSVLRRCGVNLESFDEGTMECLVDIYQIWRQLFQVNDELAAYTAFDIQMHRYSKADSCEELATRRMLRDCRTKMDILCGGDL